MRIIIVGAGLGGLAAGLCFARDGHTVQIFEQRPALSRKGSGLGIRPGAARILQSWGLHESIDSVADRMPPFVVRDLRSGAMKMRNVPGPASEGPDWGIPRPVLQDILYREAVQAGCIVSFDALVEDIVDGEWPSVKPSVRLRGSRGDTIVHADLVLVADGIRSRLRSRVLDVPVDPILTHTVFYGIHVSESLLQADREASCLLSQTEPTVWADKNRFVVARRPSKFPFWQGLYGLQAEDDGSSSRLWDEDGDINLVRKAFAGICPELEAALHLATSCDRWKIAEMPDLPSWRSKSGAVLLLGDAAHAMQPNAAQGLSQIIEDIGVLHLLLKTSNLPLPILTGLWEEIRKPRVERIKAYAAWNTRMYLGQRSQRNKDRKTPSSEEDQWKSMREVVPDASAPFNSPSFFKWAHDYDAVSEVCWLLSKSPSY
ncbi:hypothetical protein ASPZODRAFT_15545 [Penicilliopsis zonata CBS 506.65]|uniref:FAD-binding domain-containing protein n=1 Tax=Penicilliopsis zonata CBS 506.65 TaxID=1073090 RepID=A0A1L9SIE2_9EURO|nr:hypothetical protein ASPZODRAFT_15545 [Penicilliopsis zonata CBS 506.65]OJJ46853.1 hypothetical protein ASPZODRAFT_15545 [Penicilliopsis zonata CBS 506.65]